MNKRGPGKFEGIPHEEKCRRKQLLKVFVTVKTCSSFLNYVSSTSLDIALKVSSRERRRVVLLMESVQTSPCGFVCEREES